MLSRLLEGKDRLKLFLPPLENNPNAIFYPKITINLLAAFESFSKRMRHKNVEISASVKPSDLFSHLISGFQPCRSGLFS